MVGIKGFFVLQILGVSGIVLGFGTMLSDWTLRCELGTMGFACIFAATLFAWLLNGEPIKHTASLTEGQYAFLGKFGQHLYFLQRKPPSARMDPTGNPENFTEQVFKVPLAEFYHRDVGALPECLPVAIRVRRTGRNERMLELEVNPKDDSANETVEDAES